MIPSKVSKLCAVSVLVLGVAMASNADAAYIVTIQQSGSNVVATGSGSLNTDALSFYGPVFSSALIDPGLGALYIGSTSFQSLYRYTGISGPTTFGSNISSYPSIGTGDVVGVYGNVSSIYVPSGYTSGTALGTNTTTWTGATFASLGVTPGTYTWTWGSGTTADSFTLKAIATPAPEPASWALLSVGVVGLLIQQRRRPAAAQNIG